MPLRLYRYILFEMIRVILITTGVLVTVIAFGAVIKPLAGESLLTAGQAVKYVFLAMVPMLQYALPFAAGFGSTLALHRFTNDNEVLAMAVVGLSYRAILAPVVAFGVLLTLLMIVLTQSIIPQFYGMMARTLAGDVTAMIAHSVEKGVPFEFEGMQILAEHVEIYDSPQDTGADERLRLRKMIAAQLDSEGRAVTDVTAADAVIDPLCRLRLDLAQARLMPGPLGCALRSQLRVEHLAIPTASRYALRQRLRFDARRSLLVHLLDLALARLPNGLEALA